MIVVAVCQVVKVCLALVIVVVGVHIVADAAGGTVRLASPTS